ncbi:universal stress protein [Natronococcus roseus]|uniref:universal stress protein n=1 Tax=Natronococcus roseus TaxID=1052014 RepID=UPI00374CD74B
MVVIAAVDRSDRSADVVREAETLAAKFDEPLHIVHALTRSELVDLGRSAQAGESSDKDRIRDVAADIADEAASGLSMPYETVGLVGEPASAILDYAETQETRYLVVGPRKRSPAGKALFGSVAQSLLLDSEYPLVTITN